MHKLFAGLLFPCLISCGNQTLESCITGPKTITQGIFGQLFGGCDTPDCTSQYAVDDEVRVYDADPTPDPGPQNGRPYDTGTSLTPVARVVSGQQGFYQVQLSPGTYYVCSFTNLCVALTVSTTLPLVEEIFSSGPGGGLWNSCFRQ